MTDGLGEIAVHYGGLEQAAQSIRNSAKKLQTDMENLQHEVKAVSAEWQGEAHNRYQQVQRDWNTQTAEMQATLVKIANMVEKASGDYLHTDKKAASFFEI